MGRFDGPHFEAEDEDVVSVWVGVVPKSEIPEDYFEEHYSDDDGDPFNAFSTDFGFGFYDHDFVEPAGSEDGSVVPIEDALADASYSKSYRGAVAKRAAELGITRSSFVFLMFNFKYDPAVTKITASKYFKFIGVFPFDTEAE